MQPSHVFHSSVQRRFFRYICLAMIVILLVGAVFASQPNGKVQAATAATCTNNPSPAPLFPALNWNDLSTWDCGHVPTSADNVIITADSEVTLINAQSVNNLTLGASGSLGLLSFTNPVTLSVTGDINFTVDGDFDAATNGGTVLLNGTGNQTVNTNNQMMQFYNLKKVGGGQTLFFNTGANGAVEVLNNLTLRGTATNNLLLRSTSTGTSWQLISLGPRDLNWLDVQDSHNVDDSIPPLPGVVISVVNWTNSGNNTAWATDSDTTSSLAVAAVMNPSFGGRPVTLTFRVYPATATGNVSFYEGVNPVATCDDMLLIDGAVGCVVPGLSKGAHTFHAVFTAVDGSGFADATSTTIIQVMNLAFYLPVAKK